MAENYNLKDILEKKDSNEKKVLLKNGKNDIKKEDESLRKTRIENDNFETNIVLKINICNWVKCVVSLYLIFIAVILILLTFKIFGASLSSSVIIALLTTTTINILGLPLMIIKSLFPKNN